ncbi:LysE family translocator [Tropicimonas sp.]|uniref:LysE family translocator n=1 Tax=Tropicimonas sp. TaxID=2067044 RepID=UPI003A88DA31
MTINLLLALVAFSFVTAVTPGPNNLMLMASGANFGFRRTLPHALGVTFGFSFMVLLVGLGLAQVFERFPVAGTVLRVVSVVYLLWLAWKIGTAAAPGAGQGAGRPFSFLQAAGFQWVNPKAWTMALTAVSVYNPDHSLLALTTTTAIFALVTLPSCSGWMLLGQQMARVLTNRARLRLFNGVMAALLVGSLVPVLV